MNRNLIGKEYPSIIYEVGREKIREYARATLAKNPLYFDPEFARRSRYGTIAAPPTFAAVYCAQVLRMVFADSELGMNVPRVIHGEQEFRFGKVVRSGDLITTRATIEDIFSKTNRKGITNEFLVIETISVNQRSQMVCEGKWTLMERGKSPSG